MPLSTGRTKQWRPLHSKRWMVWCAEFHIPSQAVSFFSSQIAQITSRPYNADT